VSAAVSHLLCARRWQHPENEFPPVIFHFIQRYINAKSFLKSNSDPMKKMATALLLCSCFIFSANAQLRTSIAGGMNMSSVPGNSSPQWDSLNYKYSSRTGFHIGLLAETHLFNSNDLYFQTGMYYINKGRKFSTAFDSSTAGISKVSGSQFVNYMEIPLNVVYKKDISKKSRLMFGAGPYVSFLFSGRESKSIYYSNGNVDASENTSLKVPRSSGKYRNMDFGVSALAGVEFGKIFITANFSRGLSQFYTANTNTGSFKNQVIGATIGLYLNKDKKREAITRDRDGDGVPDIDDQCPRIKGSVTAKGCPDQDGDGVPDKDDNCPNIAGKASRNGCPAPDNDHDGVDNDDDKCPDVKGVKENNGCPEIDADIRSAIDRYAKRIQFKYKSVTLSKKSKEVLDEIIKILKENTHLNVLIEGYTSSDGNGRNHMSLSQRRAESVQEYFESNGINAKRLKAVGFGDTNPLNGNKTEAERAQNRRVELKITSN
jgi:outer membrane protein OmpA-like peptidoglycan-associated protein